MKSSVSEDRGIAILSKEDLLIYSVGISTGGVAEMRMAESNPQSHIIATTIDAEGTVCAQEKIQQAGLEKQIEVKIEDVAKPLLYPNEFFHFIYARLVLHYLPKQELINALNELYRILKPSGKFFVVVRSEHCPEAQDPSAIQHLDTGMTTYTSQRHSFSRYFHSEKSITSYLKEAGFEIVHVKSYKERLCVDFQRKKLASHEDVLIEVFAVK